MIDRDDALTLAVSVTVHVLALGSIPGPRMQTGTPERGGLAVSVAALAAGQPGAVPNPSPEPAAPRQSRVAVATPPGKAKTPDTDSAANSPKAADPQTPEDKNPAPAESSENPETPARPSEAKTPEPERPSAPPAKTARSEAPVEDTPKRDHSPESASPKNASPESAAKNAAASPGAKTPDSGRPPVISEAAAPRQAGKKAPETPPDNAAPLKSAAVEPPEQKIRPVGSGALPGRARPGDTGHKPGRRGITPAPKRPRAKQRPEVLARPLYHLIPSPPYPERSRDLGEEGRVVIAVLVAEDGKVAEAHVHESSGHPMLDGSALATVREKWLFKPARSGDAPVTAWIRVPIDFRISDR